MSFLRFLMLLSLVVWIGGIIFFAIMAPTAFHVLPTRLLAGTLVGNLLTKLHWIAIVCGVVYLLSSLVYSRITEGEANVFAARHVLIGGMLVLTLVSQFWITPRMLALRAQVAQRDLRLAVAASGMRPSFTTRPSRTPTSARYLGSRVPSTTVPLRMMTS